MNKTYLMIIAAALLAAPLAYAHEPPGTPKNYCEPEGDWSTHDYAPPAVGLFVLLPQDGNVFGDCSGVTNLGRPCGGIYLDRLLESDPGLCDFDPPVADYDGHSEWAIGGAILAVCDVNCGPSGTGAGSQECIGEPAHHGTSITVTDVALGAGTAFTVAADQYDIVAQTAGLPPSGCGDYEVDISQDCVGSCAALFREGLDGCYYVYVTGTAGHVTA